MNPDADTLWRAPRWALAVLLACLGMLGPFSIDTYLPAFAGIAQSIGATAVEIKRKALEEGMLTLRMSGLEKIKNGVTTVEEVLRETVL